MLACCTKLRAHGFGQGRERLTAPALAVSPLEASVIRVWLGLLLVGTLVGALSLLPALVVLAAGLPIVAWGSNGDGQATVPATLTDVIAIAGGNNHSLALKSDGTVAAWGYNNAGQADVPAGLSNVTAIGAGSYHNLALKADGTVAAWGYNDDGQLNVPAGLSNVTAIAAGAYHSLALKTDGTVVAWGRNNAGQSNVPAGLSNVIAIAGYFHSLALKGDGTVVAWGENSNGQGNVPAGLSNVTAIAAGSVFSLALKRDGTVVAWGDNSYGQCNVPAGLSDVTAIAAGAYHSLALKADGTVVAWGYNDYGQATVPAALSPVAAIAAGGFHSLALFSVAPSVTTHPADQTVTAGQPVTFTAAASGLPAPAVQWQVSADSGANWADIASATVVTYSFGTQVADSGKQFQAVFANSAGTVTTTAATLTVLDPTPPNVTPHVAGRLGKNGWYTGDVALTWQIGDAHALGAAGAACAPVALTTDTAGSTFTCVATGATGVPVTQTITLKRDATPPVGVVGTPAGAANADGSYPSPLTVVFTGTDATSGLATCSTVRYDGPNNASVALTGGCADNAGNYTTVAVNFVVDRAPDAPPAPTPSPPPAPPANWLYLPQLGR